MNKSTFFRVAKVYIKKPWVIGLVVMILLIIFFSVKGGGSSAENEIVYVKNGTVSESVSVTGKVKSAQAVDLSFEKTGRVVKINKSVGETVAVGDIIVQLDNSELFAELAQAQAMLHYQQSKLAELEAGTRPEQVDITRIKQKSAKTELDNARQTITTSLQSAYTLADDSVRNKVDELFINPRSLNPQIVFTSTITSETSLESGRVEVENRLRSMKGVITTISSLNENNLDGAIETMKRDLGEVKLFMDNISLSVNALSPTNYLSQTTLSGWKADVSSARTSVNTAITSLLSSEEKLNSAETNYATVSKQLVLDESGVVSQQIDAERAQVEQAQASVNLVYAQLSKTYIKSPINGIVSKQDAKLGETIVANTNVVSVMSDAQFEIEANIPEADVAKVKTGQIGKVTLDAYGPDLVFDVLVVSVEPAETIVDGVPTYKTTFQFERVDPRIKSGMTANVDIQGEVHENVLFIPQRAIINRSGEKYVVLETEDKKTRETKIKVGLRGFDGSVEIIEGVSLGDAVVVNQK